MQNFEKYTYFVNKFTIISLTIFKFQIVFIVQIQTITICETLSFNNIMYLHWSIQAQLWRHEP